MPMQRQFVIAPSLARLILKEKAGERVQEGYFPDQPQHRTFIQVEEARSSLILEAGGDAAPRGAGGPAARPCTSPARRQPGSGGVRAHQARNRLTRDSRRFTVVRPGPLDLVAIAVPSEDEQNFHPLPWFGPEVSTEPAYQRRRLALDSAPTVPEIDFTNAALNSLLDLLEDRFTTLPTPRHTEETDEPVTHRLQSSGIPVPVREERSGGDR